MKKVVEPLPQEDLITLFEKSQELTFTAGNVLLTILGMSELARQRPEYRERFDQMISQRLPELVRKFQNFHREFHSLISRLPCRHPGCTAKVAVDLIDVTCAAGHEFPIKRHRDYQDVPTTSAPNAARDG